MGLEGMMMVYVVGWIFGLALVLALRWWFEKEGEK